MDYDEWTTDMHVKDLSSKMQKTFRKRAFWLHEELKANRLEVVLAPAPQPRFEG